MSTDVPSLPQDADELRALLLAERQQHTHALAQHQELLARYETTVEKQQRTIAQQEHTITQLLRRISGSRQERIDPDQLMLFLPVPNPLRNESLFGDFPKSFRGQEIADLAFDSVGRKRTQPVPNRGTAS